MWKKRCKSRDNSRWHCFFIDKRILNLVPFMVSILFADSSFPKGPPGGPLGNAEIFLVTPFLGVTVDPGGGPFRISTGISDVKVD